MNKIIVKLATLVFLCSGLCAAQNTIIRSVTTLPATCTGGTAAKATDTVALVSGGISTTYVCSRTNVWTPTGAPANITSAAAYGALPGNLVADASVTSGQQTVTCTDCHFLTGGVNGAGPNCVVGQVMHGGNAASGIILADGTITACTDDTHVNVSSTAAATATGTMFFFWGPDATAALTTAWLATGAKTTGMAGNCGFLFLPAGYYWTSTAQFNFSNGCIGGGLMGAGLWNTSGIVPAYTFNYTTSGPSGSGCNGGSQSACFGGVANEDIDFLTFNGMFGGVNPGAARTMFEDNGGYFYRVGVAYWCPTCANVRGKAYTGVEPVDRDSAVANVGQINCLATGTIVNLHVAPCLGISGEVGLYVASGTTYSESTFYAGSLDAVRVIAGAQLYESNDSFANAVSGQFTNNGQHFMKHCTVTTQTITNASGGIMYIQDTDFSSVSTAHLVNNSGGFVIDQGGNSGMPASYVTNSGTYLGPQIPGNTAITAGAAVLSAGWGSTAAWSALAGSDSFSGTITSSGTGQAANPTITFTFPVRFPVAPRTCYAIQTGGTHTPIGTFTTTTGPSVTAATFTYSSTPVAAETFFIQVLCQN